MIELIVCIVIALILFKLLGFLVVPVAMAACIGWMFGPEAAGYSLIPLVILTLVAKICEPFLKK